MITLFIWLLTALLVFASLFLILLVLVQLPKKEAGAGLAFGAGSGNALTTVTKYTVVAFFLLAITLGVAYNHQHQARKGGIAPTLAVAPVAGTPAPVSSVLAPPTNSVLSTTTLVTTNRPASTNR